MGSKFFSVYRKKWCPQFILYFHICNSQEVFRHFLCFLQHFRELNVCLPFKIYLCLNFSYCFNFLRSILGTTFPTLPFYYVLFLFIWRLCSFWDDRKYWWWCLVLRIIAKYLILHSRYTSYKIQKLQKLIFLQDYHVFLWKHNNDNRSTFWLSRVSIGYFTS